MRLWKCTTCKQRQQSTKFDEETYLGGVGDGVVAFAKAIEFLKAGGWRVDVAQGIVQCPFCAGKAEK